MNSSYNQELQSCEKIIKELDDVEKQLKLKKNEYLNKRQILKDQVKNQIDIQNQFHANKILGQIFQVNNLLQEFGNRIQSINKKKQCLKSQLLEIKQILVAKKASNVISNNHILLSTMTQIGCEVVKIQNQSKITIQTNSIDNLSRIKVSEDEIDKMMLQGYKQLKRQKELQDNPEMKKYYSQKKLSEYQKIMQGLSSQISSSQKNKDPLGTFLDKY